MKGLILGGIKKIQPPGPNASPEAMHSWQFSISILVGLNAMALGVHIAIACGFLTVVHPGFALASDTQRLAQELVSYKQTQLEAAILDTRQKQCTQHGQVRALYTESLQRMLVEYERITGRPYPVPSCDGFT